MLGRRERNGERGEGKFGHRVEADLRRSAAPRSSSFQLRRHVPRGNCRNGGLEYEHGNCGFCRRLLYCRNSRDGRDRLRTNRRFNPCRFARLPQRMRQRRLQHGRFWRRLLHHLRRTTGAAARRRPRLPRNTVNGLGFHWTGSLLDWAVGGSLLAVLSIFLSYRALTRQFGWGPRDT